MFVKTLCIAYLSPNYCWSLYVSYGVTINFYKINVGKERCTTIHAVLLLCLQALFELFVLISVLMI